MVIKVLTLQNILQLIKGLQVAADWNFQLITGILPLAGYDQYGKDSTGKKLNAYYIQPEIKYTGGNFTVRLGMEYLSGAG